MIDLRVEERLFEKKEISFGIPVSDPRSGELKSDAPIVYGGDKYNIFRVITTLASDGVRIRQAFAEINWMKLADIRRPNETVIEHQSADEGLATILRNTGWSVGNIAGDIVGQYFMTVTDTTVLAMIWTWCRIVGGEPNFDSMSKTVHIVTEVGGPTNVSFRYGRDVVELEKEETPPSATRLYGFGADNLTIAGITGAPYVEDYSWYTAQGMTEGYARSEFQKDDVFSDSSFTDETALHRELTKQLAITSKPVIVYKAKVVDISSITGVNVNFKTGDYASVYDEDVSQTLTARVTRKVTYPKDPSRNEVELSFNAVPLPDSTSTSSRSGSSREWVAFTGPIAADFLIRNNGVYTVARIPLRFSTDGKFHLHLDLVGVGVGSGTVTVSIYDTITEENVEVLETEYTDGEPWRVFKTWFAGEQTGRIDYRLRVTTTADGGPSPTNGVNLTQEEETRVSWYILAQGAVRETPGSANSITFNYTGAVQKWTVPDNVEGPITMTVTGAAGAGHEGLRGAGTRVIGKWASVIPGTVYDIYVGGRANKTGITSGGADPTPGWPNGGAGGERASAGSHGGAGGGSSQIVPEGLAIGSSLIVAPGGGGRAGNGNHKGGDSGFFFGEDGASGSAADPGLGATQAAGGAGGTGSGSGTAGTFNAGGEGGDGSGLLGSGGGGGGGGIYGGGGAGGNGSVAGTGCGAGGGGAGLVHVDVYDLEIQDAVNQSVDGQIIISWEDPE